eukprot:gnl/TRDRNA2_/TRDRNA2_52168_c0_seq1.p1 gnl/TRDRNA2_/TRDRNA2_52168_c0~~gnl/TRDRNA2_/TRDRNA2_52168_c0_seq1.p1  ORF type:complete len:106 (-),score=16.23 gnl/TRDRNA2_/TRDRNA2_52168_c0_seq1:124-441(-)
MQKSQGRQRGSSAMALKLAVWLARARWLICVMFALTLFIGFGYEDWGSLLYADLEGLFELEEAPNGTQAVGYTPKKVPGLMGAAAPRLRGAASTTTGADTLESAA